MKFTVYQINLSNKDYENNVLFNGFIDLVMYNENTELFTIYDIKTMGLI